MHVHEYACGNQMSTSGVSSASLHLTFRGRVPHQIRNSPIQLDCLVMKTWDPPVPAVLGLHVWITMTGLYVSTRVPARVSFLQGMCVMTEPSSHPLLLSFIPYFGDKMWLHSLSRPSVSYITQARLEVNTVLLLNLLSARVISIHHATIPSGNF